MPKIIVGLGNPGSQFTFTRHNIGFLVLDELAQKYGGSWRTKDKTEQCAVNINGHSVLLVKPQTYMNSSGVVLPALMKHGIEPQQVLVVHDELEKPFGNLSITVGGGARGHNGLRSIIANIGSDFARLRFGIGRPPEEVTVADYVLQNFSEGKNQLSQLIDQAVVMITDLYKQ